MRSLLFLATTLVSLTTFGKFPENFDEAISRIAFGSCNRADLPQPLWPVISEKEPDLWVWLGDNIYADTKDMAVMLAKYARQFNQPNYAAFRKETPILGTWDDHDYGENNSGNWYPKREDAAVHALDFMEVPEDDPRRSRAGIYGSYRFGPEGQRVKIILLDDRYFADRPGPDATFFGEEQWRWLKDELEQTEAQVNIIACGIQMLHEDQPYEKLANFPQERERFLELIRDSGAPGVILISGDRHVHEIALKNDAETPYPLVEVTSSGMTHSWRNFPGETNRYRLGDVFTGLGFGMITINWEAEPATVNFAIVDRDGQAVETLTLPLDILQPGKIQ